jgi:hypothetical protein
MVASEKAILLVNSLSNSLESLSHLNVGLVHQIISEIPVVIASKTSQPSRPDSTKTVSGNPGAVQVEVSSWRPPTSC